VHIQRVEYSNGKGLGAVGQATKPRHNEIRERIGFGEAVKEALKRANPGGSS